MVNTHLPTLTFYETDLFVTTCAVELIKSIGFEINSNPSRSEKGYTEVKNEDFEMEYGFKPGDAEFYKELLLPQELQLHNIDYHVISIEQEPSFREELERFVNEVK